MFHEGKFHRFQAISRPGVFVSHGTGHRIGHIHTHTHDDKCIVVGLARFEMIYQPDSVSLNLILCVMQPPSTSKQQQQKSHPPETLFGWLKHYSHIM